MRRMPLAVLIAFSFFATSTVAADQTAALDTAYPGTIKIAVDATDLSHRIFRVSQDMPVEPGPLSLHYPQWLPGNHSPSGPIDKLAGLIITAGGKRLPWKRDPLDVYTIKLVVPDGASALKLDYQFLSPLDRNQGRVVMTPEIIGLQWNTLLLYPAGYAADRITYSPHLKLPADWKLGGALEIASQSGAETQFKDATLENLVDSPVFAGKYFRQFNLDPKSAVPVRLNVVADAPYMLEATPEALSKHQALVRQADKLYGARHYKHYDFLLALTDRFSGIGLEHHQSSENSGDIDYLTDDKHFSGKDLLPHEYTHSWNGKFRRGADLATPHYNVPMQDSLLWVYEGQTEYWGKVLAARSRLMSAEQVRDQIASVAAAFENRRGREWRDLEDTTNQPIISHRAPQPWTSWQRAEDYYSEGLLLWLDADTLIREKTGGKKSLDDFARAFFGVEDGRIAPLTYTFDDVATALNGVVAHGWAAFLRERLDSLESAPLDGLARGGWKLVFTDKPNAVAEAKAKKNGNTDFTYSLGLSVSNKDMRIIDVQWNSPAFNAGLASSMTLVAVNGIAAKAEELTRAITDSQKSGSPIFLLVNDLDHLQTVVIDYRGGLKYPHLQRIDGKPDRLSAILAPRK
jgi:predicted metalloprotease with PDZ domain